MSSGAWENPTALLEAINRAAWGDDCPETLRIPPSRPVVERPIEVTTV